uniref:ATP synthase F0 subunit 8 n=1 Tax=Tetranychus evansi TaxID=178897 RepID=A0A8F2PQW0_9ACAR|nr:ATP synthase F0 subunit 8 [Tetranychus evansi]
MYQFSPMNWILLFLFIVYLIFYIFMNLFFFENKSFCLNSFKKIYVK